MKASEPRLGNYIKVIEVPAGTWAVVPFGYCKLDLDTLSLIHKYPHAFEYIPLTTQWLIKFGFVHIGAAGSDIWSFNGVEIWKQGERFGHSYVYGSDVDNVHDLQNLYFYLTGEELTIK